MNEETIEKIGEEFESSFSGEKNKVFKGLRILSKYSEDISINPTHDELFAGVEDYSKMTEEDVREMFRLDWRWSDNSFAIFT